METTTNPPQSASIGAMLANTPDSGAALTLSMPDEAPQTPLVDASADDENGADEPADKEADR